MANQGSVQLEGVSGLSGSDFISFPGDLTSIPVRFHMLGEGLCEGGLGPKLDVQLLCVPWTGKGSLIARAAAVLLLPRC